MSIRTKILVVFLSLGFLSMPLGKGRKIACIDGVDPTIPFSGTIGFEASLISRVQKENTSTRASEYLVMLNNTQNNYFQNIARTRALYGMQANIWSPYSPIQVAPQNLTTQANSIPGIWDNLPSLPVNVIDFDPNYAYL